jgi:adenosylhomocysteinase
MNLGCATGHPSFVMSNSFTNQAIAQIELFTKTGSTTRSACTRCPRCSTRRWPDSTSTPSGVRLTELTPDQADYIGVSVQGPYKPEHYRY